MTYYIIETQYVGPNANESRNIDAHKIEIRDTPESYWRGDICLDGHCFTYCDSCVIAHGAYDTIDAARQAITDIFGDTRDCDANDDFRSLDPSVIETYKPGLYEPLSYSDTQEHVYMSCDYFIKAETTDQEAKELADYFVEESKSRGYLLGDGVYDMVIDYREGLREREQEEVA